MNNKMCAIHQPNFFPWLGYFNKIDRCDIFVILDNVQFPKTGGSWINRVAISVKGEKRWLTAPVNRQKGLWKVNETHFKNSYFRDKIKKTLQSSYAKCAYFKVHKEFVFELIDYKSNLLVDYNINAISKICDLFGITFKKKMVLQSELNTENKSTQLLIEILKKVHSHKYLCGGGANGYQEDKKFIREGFELIYQNFQHPVYSQFKTKEFISGLSIIDVLFNCGVEKTIRLISPNINL